MDNSLFEKDYRIHKLDLINDPYINVKDYGAKGDGYTDDTPIIQKAFNDSIVLKIPVFFPSGTYNVTGIKTNRAVSFFGAGREYSIIQGTVRTNDVITMEIPYAYLGGFFMRDIQIKGGENGLITHNAEPANITNCEFVNQREANLWAGFNAFQWHIENCRFIGGRYNVKFKSTGNTDIINKLTGTGASGQLSTLLGNWYYTAKQQSIYLRESLGVNILGGYFELIANDGELGNAQWTSSTSKNIDDIVNINSGTANGFVYRCKVAGITGGVIPTATSGNVTDGTVQWEVLGRRACLYVETNQGFRMIGMQGERLQGTPWVIVNGASSYSASSIIADNSIQQTYPAPAIELINENRVYITNNHIVDCAAWLSVPANSNVKGIIAQGNIYQNEKTILGTMIDSKFSNNLQSNNSNVFSLPNDAWESNTINLGTKNKIIVTLPNYTASFALPKQGKYMSSITIQDANDNAHARSDLYMLTWDDIIYTDFTNVQLIGASITRGETFLIPTINVTISSSGIVTITGTMTDTTSRQFKIYYGAELLSELNW